MERKPKLMISYCHVNKAAAQKIRGLLEHAFDILIDENYFQLSKSTYPEMKRMVGDADVVLVLLSPASVASSAVRYEVKCALNREADEQRKIIFAAMIERCKPMPEWDSTRLYASLHSSFTKEFARLKRSLISGAAKALPRATAIPDSLALVQLTKESLANTGFNIVGDIELVAHDAQHSENYLRTKVFDIHRAQYSVFLATSGIWTCFLYVPKLGISGLGERAFAYDRFTVRSLIGSRLGGYLSNPGGGRRADSPHAERLIRLFRRFPKQIDVIISPHQISTSYVKKFDVKTLSWTGTKANLLFKTDTPHAGVATLPIFVAHRLANREMLFDALRALKSALRMELKSHAAAAERWNFLRSESLGFNVRKTKSSRRGRWY